MTSSRLRDQLARELPRLAARGERGLVEAFLGLDHGAAIGRLERYVEECRKLARNAAKRDARWLATLLDYLVGRTLAFPLDRPRDALPGLVELLAELELGPERGGLLPALVELEVWRACHKIDAPGHLAQLVPGLRALWPRLRGDVGPCAELLDVVWRTGWWCRDRAVMAEARALARELPATLRFSSGYWLARERMLEGAAEEASGLLEAALADREEMQAAGESWQLYLEVEAGRAAARAGDAAAARARLAAVRARLPRARDPMLWWELASGEAEACAAARDTQGEAAAWQAALDVVEGLGTERLEAEFALALARAADAAGDREAFARARALLSERLPRLASRADLEREARRIPGLCS